MADERLSLKKLQVLDEREMTQRIMIASGYLQARFEYDTNGYLLYEGYAYPGSDEADEVWLIFKYEVNGDGRPTAKKVVQNAWDFENQWTQRATYTYI